MWNLISLVEVEISTIELLTKTSVEILSFVSTGTYDIVEPLDFISFPFAIEATDVLSFNCRKSIIQWTTRQIIGFLTRNR